MHTAIRHYATAGVALLGAGTIAITPISPIANPINIARQSVSHAGVDLVALVNPVTAYTNLVTHTVASLTGLANEVAADPLPILRAILTNSAGNAHLLADALTAAGDALATQLNGLPASLDAVRTQLENGQVADAIVGLFGTGTNLLLAPALPLIGGVVPVIQNMVANYNDVIQNALPISVALVALTPIYPINATVSAFAALAQDVVDSFSAGDFASAIQDFVAAPAVLTDAFLNGFPGGPTAFIDPAGGLLSGASVGFGSVENLLQAAKAIAAQLTRPVPPPAAFRVAAPHVVPKADATSVTLAPPVAQRGVAAPATARKATGARQSGKATSGPTSSTGHAKAPATGKAGSKRVAAKSGR